MACARSGVVPIRGVSPGCPISLGVRSMLKRVTSSWCVVGCRGIVVSRRGRSVVGRRCVVMSTTPVVVCLHGSPHEMSNTCESDTTTAAGALSGGNSMGRAGMSGAGMCGRRMSRSGMSIVCGVVQCVCSYHRVCSTPDSDTSSSGSGMSSGGMCGCRMSRSSRMCGRGMSIMCGVVQCVCSYHRVCSTSDIDTSSSRGGMGVVAMLCVCSTQDIQTSVGGGMSGGGGRVGSRNMGSPGLMAVVMYCCPQRSRLGTSHGGKAGQGLYVVSTELQRAASINLAASSVVHS
jgi:hypothetical protein